MFWFFKLSLLFGKVVVKEAECNTSYKVLVPPNAIQCFRLPSILHGIDSVNTQQSPPKRKEKIRRGLEEKKSREGHCRSGAREMRQKSARQAGKGLD